MNILVILHSIHRNGAPLFALDMGKVLIDAGHKCTYWVVSDGELESSFLEIGDVLIVNPFEEKELNKKIESYDLAILYTVLVYRFYDLVKDKIPFFWYIHEGKNIEEYMENNRLNEVFLRAENIVVVSDYVKTVIQERYGKKSVILQNFVEDIYSGMAPKNKEREDKVYFYIAGTLCYRKGYDILLDAIDLLDRKTKDKMKIYMCGERDTNNTRIKDYLGRLEGYNEIIDCGEMERDDALNLCMKCHYVVVPSRDESCSLVALEGAMLGKPLILTDSVGAKTLIKNQNGWIVKSGAASELAGAIKEAIEQIDIYEQRSLSIRQEYLRSSTRSIYERNLLMCIDYFTSKKKNVLEKLCDKYNEWVRKNFVCPFLLKQVPFRSRIAIYGAGKYGEAWNVILSKSNYYKIVAWVDKNVKREGIITPGELKKIKLDYILITLRDDRFRREVKDELLGMGFRSKQLLYQKDCSNELM